MNLPRISIITPCYNMEKYIESAILSVVSQNYPNLEYIIVDGGSKDLTLKLINKYKNQISVLISEPDYGMYDAIDKGFRNSTGEILAWLNADDCYFPWTLQIVAHIFSNFPNVKWIDGMTTFFDENKLLTNISTHPGAKSQKAITNGWFKHGIYGCLPQATMFWRRDLYFQCGGLDKSYRYSGDFELWTRFANYAELVTLSIPLSGFMRRSSGLSLGSPEKYNDELIRASKGKKTYPSFLWYLSTNRVYTRMLRLLTIMRSPLCFYSYRHQKFIIKYVHRSVSAYSFSEMRYGRLFDL